MPGYAAATALDATDPSACTRSFIRNTHCASAKATVKSAASINPARRSTAPKRKISSASPAAIAGYPAR